ncbi:dipeptide epimerase [Arthrobacter sp. BL-252-APC-1A]|uniref:mandelate racemase/muconate lactonizing enzyme family protein n=1 Tax=Arthrobacter sp. BL-252-APC-1A TaxID=2606622 RepID=UPI0012B1FAE3|nr:dipeptide epimerase [Arthrobacter sp. BL-252-APC-1A]MSR98491.1 dipeptide epimerase [Arthrobacter sp. BL-252-APC-1A]
MGLITALDLYPLSLPLTGTFSTAVRTSSVLETVLFRLQDSDGRSGWGETPVSRVTGVSTTEVLARARQDLAPLVIGRPISDLDRLVRRIAGAPVPSAVRMGLDCALHDLAAVTAGQPLHRFLAATYPQVAGPKLEDTVLTDMTLSAAEPQTLAATATGWVQKGFRCLKVKLRADLDAVAGLTAVRAAVGPAVRLRVDANQAYIPDEAIQVLNAMAAAGVGLELVEQPVAAADWAGLARVRAAVDVPVMADESVQDERDLAPLLKHRAATLVNLKLAKTGGIYPAVRLLAAARGHGLGILVGCMLESTVGAGAGAALAAAAGLGTEFPGRSGQDLDGGLWPAVPSVDGGVRYDGPVLHLPSVPGQGITGLHPGLAAAGIRTDPA